MWLCAAVGLLWLTNLVSGIFFLSSPGDNCRQNRPAYSKWKWNKSHRTYKGWECKDPCQMIHRLIPHSQQDTNIGNGLLPQCKCLRSDKGYLNRLNMPCCRTHSDPFDASPLGRMEIGFWYLCSLVWIVWYSLRTKSQRPKTYLGFLKPSNSLQCLGSLQKCFHRCPKIWKKIMFTL